MFQQAAGEGVELADRRRQPLQRLGVPVEQPQHQPAQRLVGDARFRQAAQLGEHLVAVVARVLDKLGGVEAVGAVVLGHVADGDDVDLRAVALVLAVGAAELVEAALVPLRLAVLEGCRRPRP